MEFLYTNSHEFVVSNFPFRCQGSFYGINLNKNKKQKIIIKMNHIREITHEYGTAFKAYIESKIISYNDRKDYKATERYLEDEEYRRSLTNPKT